MSDQLPLHHPIRTTLDLAKLLVSTLESLEHANPNSLDDLKQDAVSYAVSYALAIACDLDQSVANVVKAEEEEWQVEYETQ